MRLVDDHLAIEVFLQSASPEVAKALPAPPFPTANTASNLRQISQVDLDVLNGQGLAPSS